MRPVVRKRETSGGVADSVVLERLSNTPARIISAHARLEPCDAVAEQAMGARSLGAPKWVAKGKAVAFA